MSASESTDKPEAVKKPPVRAFTIRLRNRLDVSGGVPSQWLAVYVVYRGKVVCDFPFELSELAEARSLQFDLDDKATKLAEVCRRSRLGAHLYLASARRGEVDTRSLDSGVFLGRSAQFPTGVELDARAMVQLFLGRLARIRETQPGASGLLAQREFETLLRPVDPELRVARSLDQLRRVGSPLVATTRRVALEK